MNVRKILNYFRNLFVAADQFGNAAIGGDPDETISSQAGKEMRRRAPEMKNALYWRWRALVDLLQGLGVPRGHWEASIEDNEGHPPLPLPAEPPVDFTHHSENPDLEDHS